MPQARIGAITVFLLLILQMSTDIYLPSLPSIAHDLATNETYAQLTLSLFLGGFAISQLFYGPLSDYFGRKPIILIGITAFLVLNILCTLATSIDQLLWFRFLAGVGGGSCSVISRAIARDVFTGKSLEKINSYQLITWSIIPVIAPLIGSYIQHYSNWRYNFVLLSIIGLLATVIVLFLLPETRAIEHKPDSLQVKSTIKSYARILSNRNFIAHIVVAIGFISATMSMSVEIPFLIQSVLGYSVLVYGWIILAVASSFIIGTLLGRRLARTWSNPALFKLGLSLILLASFVMLCFALFGIFNLWVLIIPLFMIQLGGAGIFYKAVATCQQPFADIAGICGACIGFTCFIGSMFVSAWVSSFPAINAMPLSGTLFALAIIMFAVWWRFSEKQSPSGTSP